MNQTSPAHAKAQTNHAAARILLSRAGARPDGDRDGNVCIFALPSAHAEVRLK
jgi:hypothetical protein